MERTYYRTYGDQEIEVTKERNVDQNGWNGRKWCSKNEYISKI
ncbi:MAG: hypothetical protein ACOYB8_06770 [Eubacteriaceae bacterium]